MNENVTVAVLRLQTSLLQGRLQPWRAEQAEEALNYLLSRPDRAGNPFHLVRNAMSDARKKLQRRAALFSENIPVFDVMSEVGAMRDTCGGEGFDVLRADIIDSICRTSTLADQRILAAALDGYSPSDVADQFGVSYEIAKVRLSRARQRAREAWTGTQDIGRDERPTAPNGAYVPRAEEDLMVQQQ